jgi:acyl-CoA synthetase (AMP-forming)/AMP-acid ligase II
MLLEAVLENSAQRHPEKLALVCASQRLSYGEVEQQSNSLANELIALGLQRGDRVAICLENSVEAVITVFAILKAGAVFVIINPTTKAEKLAFVLDNSDAWALIASAAKIEASREVLGSLTKLHALIAVGVAATSVSQDTPRIFGWKALTQSTGLVGPPPKRCIDVDLAALVYTSGSTGNPKGVMLTHINMVAAATSITNYLENQPDEVILNVLPLSFDYGLYQVLMAFRLGGTVVLEKSFAYPHAVLQKMAAEKVTGFPIVPTMSRFCDFTTRSPSLRYITNTGAAPRQSTFASSGGFPAGPAVFDVRPDRASGSYLPPDQPDLRPTSVGKAC